LISRRRCGPCPHRTKFFPPHSGSRRVSFPSGPKSPPPYYARSVSFEGTFRLFFSDLSPLYFQRHLSSPFFREFYSQSRAFLLFPFSDLMSVIVFLLTVFPLVFRRCLRPQRVYRYLFCCFFFEFLSSLHVRISPPAIRTQFLTSVILFP